MSGEGQTERKGKKNAAREGNKGLKYGEKETQSERKKAKRREGMEKIEKEREGERKRNIKKEKTSRRGANRVI